MKRLWRQIGRLHSGLRFAMVGGVGFLVDTATMFSLLEVFRLELGSARVIAFFCAASCNWVLNRHFTFPERIGRSGLSTEWARFVTSATLSAIPNLGLFFVLMLMLPKSPGYILLAMSCGILAGYACNYWLARSWVFKTDTS